MPWPDKLPGICNVLHSRKRPHVEHKPSTEALTYYILDINRIIQNRQLYSHNQQYKKKRLELPSG